MRKPFVFLFYYFKAKLTESISAWKSIEHLLYKNEVFLSNEEVQLALAESIRSGKPFMAARFGATELSAVKTFDFQVTSKYEIAVHQMAKWSGFFPKDTELCCRFKDIMLVSIPAVDYIAVWNLPFEEYYLRHYKQKTLRCMALTALEPWSNPKQPWSSALKGKKVLVIHPFEETIQKQYSHRETLFPGTDILPEFELRTLKAVQTIAGETDGRFATWFDALEWMYQEALKVDFDIAIIGCGAYGFPLAAKLKRAGKQAIHLGGATQILFGIKGRRWEQPNYKYVQRFFNDSWVYPSTMETPPKADNVEGGCYWA